MPITFAFSSPWFKPRLFRPDAIMTTLQYHLTPGPSPKASDHIRFLLCIFISFCIPACSSQALLRVSVSVLLYTSTVVISTIIDTRCSLVSARASTSHLFCSSACGSVPCRPRRQLMRSLLIWRALCGESQGVECEFFISGEQGLEGR